MRLKGKLFIFVFALFVFFSLCVWSYSEIIFERAGKIAKITMNRPEKLNAFTPVTVQEMIDAFTICRDDSSIGVIILTGAGDKAFSSGGDQSVRGNGGYVGPDKIARLNVLDLQHLIPKHHLSSKNSLQNITLVAINEFSINLQSSAVLAST